MNGDGGKRRGGSSGLTMCSYDMVVSSSILLGGEKKNL